MKLKQAGWSEFFENTFEPFRNTGWIPARVVRDNRGIFAVLTEGAELIAELSGRCRYESELKDTFPVVGDWVALQARMEEGRGTIHALLPRRTWISRKSAGSRTEEQVLAANVDVLFIVNALDGGRNLNLRRIERYLTIAWDSGADPVIVLNKIDLCDNVDACVREVESVAADLPILPVSATERRGLDALRDYLREGVTCAMLGLSGVGKSALINSLLGRAERKVQEVREEDRRGRHTTTQRELIQIPGGGMIIDTPGLRELQPWGEGDGTAAAFADIEKLAQDCQFRDCRHEQEPGCAVHTALASGELDHRRFESYLHMRKEEAYLARRKDQKAQMAEKEKWRQIAKWSREYTKNNPKRRTP